MFFDWKKQHCENDYTPQSNLQIQWNPYQTTSGIFQRIEGGKEMERITPRERERRPPSPVNPICQGCVRDLRRPENSCEAVLAREGLRGAAGRDRGSVTTLFPPGPKDNCVDGAQCSRRLWWLTSYLVMYFWGVFASEFFISMCCTGERDMNWEHATV